MKKKSNTVTQAMFTDLKKRQEQMPSTKIEAFLKEFPWVTEFVSCSEINQVYVSRVSPELIGKDLEYVSIRQKTGTVVDPFCGGEDIYENVNHTEVLWLLDENGKCVRKTKKSLVTIPTVQAYRKYWPLPFGPIIPMVPEHKEEKITWCTGKIVNQTIGETLKKLEEVADSVRFILSFWDHSKVVILYKVPKDITLPLWIQRQIEAEQADFKKECDTIDAEVATV